MCVSRQNFPSPNNFSSANFLVLWACKKRSLSNNEKFAAFCLLEKLSFKSFFVGFFVILSCLGVNVGWKMFEDLFDGAKLLSLARSRWTDTSPSAQRARSSWITAFEIVVLFRILLQSFSSMQQRNKLFFCLISVFFHSDSLNRIITTTPHPRQRFFPHSKSLGVLVKTSPSHTLSALFIQWKTFSLFPIKTFSYSFFHLLVFPS